MAIRKIRKVTDPTIELDAMQISDKEFSTDQHATRDDRYQLSKTMGEFSPLVIINNMRFEGEMIRSLSIDLSGFIPTITVTLQEQGGVFSSYHFPKDGDLISVLIRSKNPDYKTVIRNDYKVLDVSAGISADAQGEVNRFTLTGILNIPGMYSEKYASYTGTSFEVMKKVSGDLALGFATNEESTDDSMSWLCPGCTPLEFLKEDLSKHAYNDESSFYTAFVDQYYYLNLVEVNSLFTFDEELENIRTTWNSDEDFLNYKKELELREVPLFLSNSKEVAGTPQQITGYSPINNSGNVSLRNAYRRVLQYYDKSERERVEYFLETLNTQGSDAEDKVILKGREGEDISQHIKYKYLGVQANDNMHPQYLHSKVQNFQNLQEVTKVGLVLELAEVNPALYRFQVIPVFIINKGNQIRRDLTQDKAQEDTGSGTMDKFLSGFYIIHSIKYIWSTSLQKFTQRLTLYKREYDRPLDKSQG